MASKVLAFVTSKKARPWLIGGVVLVGGIILLMMLRGGGGSAQASAGASGPSEALQAAQLQSATSIALGAQAANVETARFAGELQGFMYGKDVDLALGGLQAEVEMYKTGAQANVALAGIEAQTRVTLAGEETSRIGINAQRDVQTAGIEAQRYIAGAQYDYMTQQSAQQFSFLTAQENSRRDVDLARINADVSMNQANQKTARKGQTLGFLGSVVGGVLGLFSDERLKENIHWTGQSIERNPSGRGYVEYGKYDWSWRGSGDGGHGVIAQDIASVKPEAITMYRRGRMLVNYEAVA